MVKAEARALDEHFVELPPELCSLKIIGFSKDIGSSLSLLPSVMHRLENLLVAIELKGIFSLSFPEGSEVTADRVLEAITTEKCMERFSLERLEVLGDAFLKYAVGRHVFLLHETIDEGQLTRKRSSIVKNSHLYKLAIQSNLQVYIRDENFDPSRFFALGRPCTVICNENTENSIHFQQKSGNITNGSDSISVRCSKGHHWLQKKTIADIVEALVGAFLVDSGFKAAIAFLKWIGIQVDFEATQVSKMCLASKNYMSISSNIDIPALEKSLGYTFLHKGLLVQAFVHPSYNKHSGGCYQRLEFLGDAVLDYLITSYLFSVYPKLKPGQLTDLRSVTVNNNVFAHVAVCRSFHRYLINDSDDLSEAVKKFVISSLTSAEKDPIEGSTCPKALGDLVESCVGAVLLDTGFNLNIVWKIMLTFLDPIMKFSNLQLNPVRELTELCQSRCWELQFSESKKGAVFIVHARVTTGGSVEPEENGQNLYRTITFISRGESSNGRNHHNLFSNRCGKQSMEEEEYLTPHSTFKARGYNPKKSGSLEHVLKSSKKQEAKLIGYDEEPTEEVFFDLIQLKNLVIGDGSSTSAANTLDPQTVNEEEPNYISGSSTDGRKPTVALEAPVQHLPAIREISISVDEVPTHIRASSSNNRQPTVALEAPVQHLPQPIIVLEAPVRHLPVIREDSISATVSHNGGVSHKLSAKSRLFEICAVNHWKAPVFECVKEEGPSHLKLFTYKVTVEVGEVTRIFIECFSEPRAKKKAAEEHAAEGALWCLQHQGLMRDHQRGILTPV
ncbi:hypothetical protein IFM89_018554 [Coptis chinensis]|uniref:Dicer-like protein 4 n=1 Tax=Coptis chinensis TaxID=261450 RepID=A0A835M5A0_9MAGN|nr:hypothetical protein IFM89_018554 [Coptis chinensis]